MHLFLMLMYYANTNLLKIFKVFNNLTVSAAIRDGENKTNVIHQMNSRWKNNLEGKLNINVILFHVCKFNFKIKFIN